MGRELHGRSGSPAFVLVFSDVWQDEERKAEDGIAGEGYSSRVVAGRDNGFAYSPRSTECLPNCLVGCILGGPGIG